MHFEDLIDAAVQLEYDEVNVENWKSIAHGSGLSVGVNPQILEQLMANARFVSLDCELVDLGLTDRIIEWGSRNYWLNQGTISNYRPAAIKEPDAG